MRQSFCLFPSRPCCHFALFLESDSSRDPQKSNCKKTWAQLGKVGKLYQVQNYQLWPQFVQLSWFRCVCVPTVQTVLTFFNIIIVSTRCQRKMGFGPPLHGGQPATIIIEFSFSVRKWRVGISVRKWRVGIYLLYPYSQPRTPPARGSSCYDNNKKTVMWI